MTCRTFIQWVPCNIQWFLGHFPTPLRMMKTDAPEVGECSKFPKSMTAFARWMGSYPVSKKRFKMAIVLDGFRGCRSLDTLGIVIMHGLEMSIMKTSHSTLGFTKRCLTLLGSGNGQLCAEIMNTWLGSFIAKFTETVGMFGLWFQIWFISIQTWIFRMTTISDISGGSKTPRCCPSASPCQASHSRSLSIVANNVHDFQIAANKAVDSVP